MSLFDRYVVVDWSAAARPTTGPNSIWIADLDARSSPAPTLSNPSTRRAAEGALGELVASSTTRRVLLACDASLGFPVGTAASWGLDGVAWRAIWSDLARRMHDDERNCNDRFDVAADLNRLTGDGPGPFWGAPSGAWAPALERTKPSFGERPEYRLTERRLRECGQHPKAVWQLLGAGSVGSQTLTLLPVLWRLLQRFEPRIGVWPLSTGFAPIEAAAGDVVIAEVWPSQFQGLVPVDTVKDAHQVAETALALMSADRSGSLAGWMTPDLDDGQRSRVEGEEGWVLGPSG